MLKLVHCFYECIEGKGLVLLILNDEGTEPVELTRVALVVDTEVHAVATIGELVHSGGEDIDRPPRDSDLARGDTRAEDGGITTIRDGDP